ncbi:MAG: carbohydrate kinase family protein [Saprospiraceae bacterium]
MAVNPAFDILSVGELLIDFISTDFAETFEEVENFKRIMGGSPANLCMNMARLGNQTKLVASLGKDGMGQYLLDFVKELNVNCDHIERVVDPTTIILVTRSKAVSDFEAYRGADCQISWQQFPDEIFDTFRIFHTTCFALSKEPAQSTIMQAAHRAADRGAQLSIDANYAQKIWSDRTQAQQIVADYCGLGAIVKVSEVDWERLYEKPLDDAKVAAEHFLKLGAKEVCVTLGEDGCLVANDKEQHFLPTRKVEVKDTTGAGDAFWSGYLTAWLDGKSLLECALTGRRVAELKLARFGTLPLQIDRQQVYQTML